MLAALVRETFAAINGRHGYDVRRSLQDDAEFDSELTVNFVKYLAVVELIVSITMDDESVLLLDVRLLSALCRLDDVSRRWLLSSRANVLFIRSDAEQVLFRLG